MATAFPVLKLVNMAVPQQQVLARELKALQHELSRWEVREGELAKPGRGEG